MTERQLDLINAYCSGSISDTEFSELESLLRSDPTFRKVFLEYRGLDSALRTALDSGALGNPLINEVEKKPNTTFWTIANLAALVLVSMGVWYMLSSDFAPVQIEERQDDGVAVYMRGLNVEFNGVSYSEGDTVPPGLLKLSQGYVELEFYSGASVVLEGPAELEIQSRHGGVLHKGKLRALVPDHAHGFTITSKDVQLVDLGTSFGMSVGKDAGTEVQVFDGKVELFSPVASPQIGKGMELKAGEGRHLSNNAISKPIGVDASTYLSGDELAAKANAKSLSGYAVWESDLLTSHERDDLIVRYGFTKNIKHRRILENHSSYDHPGLDGAIIGAQWSQGRWPQKQALDFKRPGDRVRIHVNGTYESMTLSTWVRIDGFDNKFNSLMLTDGWDHTGAVHWQIIKNGEIELAVQNGVFEINNNSRAPFVVNPTDFGRWVHIATVYNGPEAKVVHYRDGREIGTVHLDIVVPLKIKTAELGNWTTNKSSIQNVRNFNGRMDDFSIYSRVLSPREIRTLYEKGKL